MGCIGFWTIDSLFESFGLVLSEVGLVEFDGFEVELNLVLVEVVVGLMSLVLFLGNEMVFVRLRSLVWFFGEPFLMVLVWFFDERLLEIFFLIGKS